jgi:N-methylhydantoinase B
VEARGAVANTAGDGVRHGAAGIHGGRDGAPHHYRLRRADGEERVLRTKEVGITVQPGDRLLVRSGGGGGWGPPEGRDPALRERDAREGYV